MLFPNMNGADLSECRRYRYRLWRTWSSQAKTLVFCGLNPSTADEKADDATIRWLIGWGSKHGYGKLIVVNLFAWRATNPAELVHTSSPVQPIKTTDNDDAIIITASSDEAGLFLCGWGNHGRMMERDQQVLSMLKRHKVRPYAIKRNRDGSPSHPLRNPHTLKPLLYS